MAHQTSSLRRRARHAATRTLLLVPVAMPLLWAQAAHAQAGRLVSACSGVSLPPSVVTGIIAPTIIGSVGPTENAVNSILSNPLLGLTTPPLTFDATGLLAQAAAGNPITLQALATDGTVVGPTDQCRVTSDSVTLNTPAGIAIGGNQISGLGANGAPAVAADIGAIALGNNARTGAGAPGSVALGANSGVTVGNSVALGAGSLAARGALAGYTAPGLVAARNSAGEVSIGAPGALRQITNVAAGTAADDAATVGQVTGLIGAAGPVRYAAAASPTVPNGGTVSDDLTLVGASGGAVGLHNVRAGVVAAGSTDAVNGDQLATTNARLAALTTTVAVSGPGPVRYSTPAAPTTPGTVQSNDVTLVGADAAAPVALHNVAAGAVAAGSTDAVNGGQLFAVSTASANGVQYDRTAAGTRGNTVTLAGGNAAAPVTVANVAAGSVAAGSTEAVNGGQLAATNQVAQQAAALGANAVQYDAGRASVSLGGAGTAPVTLRNLGAGTAATDAANVGQLTSGMQGAVAAANGYTDARLASLGFDLRNVGRQIGAGTSSALAAAALPQANEPGRTMIALGGGTYRGQTAIAFGASAALDDGHSIVRLGATYDSRGYAGGNAGFGYQF